MYESAPARLNPCQLAPHRFRAVQPLLVDQTVGPSRFPDLNGTISTSTQVAATLAPEERDAVRDSFYECVFIRSEMLFLLWI